ncbi:MAG: 2-hydroxyacid dehydrogenase [Deltaproteobacteria bacterium]
MNVGIFSTQPYDREPLVGANRERGHALSFLEARLGPETAEIGAQFEAVCVFVNDQLTRGVLERLRAGKTRLVALRCAGFNNVDLAAAAELGLTVARVPAYSPHSVAELAMGLILMLNRKLHRAYARVREANFSLVGLCGFDLQGRQVGVLGTGAIGAVFCRILRGFECRVIAADPQPNPVCRELGVEYVSRSELFRRAEILSLHCPLTADTRHVVNAESLAQMQRGVMIINTGRGALIDSAAAVAALKTGHLGYLGIDVYEEEETLFFRDRSQEIVQDDVFMRLLSFPNVVVTAHQGFFTREALANIAETTLANLSSFEQGTGPLSRVPT